MSSVGIVSIISTSIASCCTRPLQDLSCTRYVTEFSPQWTVDGVVRRCYQK